MVAYRQTNRRRTILILLVVTAITLITLDQRTSGGGFVRTVAHDALSPLQSGVGAVVSPVSDWFSGVFDAGSLKSENRSLRRKLEDAQGKIDRASTAEQENERLKKLLELQSVTQIPSTAARVVGGAVGNFEWTVQIDRGSNSGIAVGMPVVSGEGLVGRIVETSADRSIVLLLTDPKSGVGVRSDRTGVTGIAEGRTGRSELKLGFVDAKADVKEGDLFVTSGLQNGRYPAGIPVGKIASVGKRDGVLDLDAQIAPAVDFTNLEFVKVLKYKAPGQ